jgi:hypothetical protein
MVTQLRSLPTGFVLPCEVSEWFFHLFRGSTSLTFVSRITEDRGQRYDYPQFILNLFNEALSTACVKWLSYCERNRPTTRHEGAWEERQYRSYSFLTSALEG